jgi:hypothetical protein
MPVELGLPLMAAIGANCMNPERELLDHEVDEVDGVPLRMPIDLQSPNSSSVIDGRVLISSDLGFRISLQIDVLDVQLYVMAWHAPGIATRVQSSSPNFARKALEPIS